MKIYSVLLLWIVVAFLPAQQPHQNIAVQLKDNGLKDGEAYAMLVDLTTTVGNRLSGSLGYDKAVKWAQRQLMRCGVDTVWLEPVTIPHWTRGNIEKAEIISKRNKRPISICALGGSVATAADGITARVIEVHSLEEVRSLGALAKGKIVFYNRPFDNTIVNTFEAYGKAVDQRGRGAVEAAQVGAIGVLVRSMTNAIDRNPHTGAMRVYDSIPKIPAAAISTVDAEVLSAALKNDASLVVHMTLNCKTMPDVPSYNVIGEIRGKEFPDEIVLIGAHLDSWDKGTGAHDDGSGVVQCIDALRLIKKLQIPPKRTIRCVLFANEENGIRGAKTYAANINNSLKRHIAAIESDEGGFTPRGFGVTSDSAALKKLGQYSEILDVVNAGNFDHGGGGADIEQITTPGTVFIGLRPDNQRYFDYHHSDLDTIDKVHPRELQLGCIAMAILTWCISQDGF